MIGNISFVSKSEASKCKITTATYLISIIDSLGKRPSFNRKFGKILKLEFDDVIETYVGLSESQVPDLMPNHENGQRIIVDNCEFCDYTDALRIHEFLKDMHESKELMDLVVHCEIGVSRSAAVAKFAAEYHGGRLDLFQQPTDQHNQRLFRLLVKAYKSESPIMHAVYKPENWVGSSQQSSTPRSHVRSF